VLRQPGQVDVPTAARQDGGVTLGHLSPQLSFQRPDKYRGSARRLAVSHAPDNELLQLTMESNGNLCGHDDMVPTWYRHATTRREHPTVTRRSPLESLDFGAAGARPTVTTLPTPAAPGLSRHYNVGMDGLRFEWDARKDALNQTRHGVSFTEAKTVFFDPHALVIDDPDHSIDEERFIILGHSRALRLLVVVHCLRASGSTIRIISARKATRREAASYLGGGQRGN